MAECGKRETCRNYGVRCADCWATSNIYDTHPCYTIKDLVEVVRCEGCRHRHYMIDRTYRYCDLHNMKVYADDFCSYGEAKMDGKGEGE